MLPRRHPSNGRCGGAFRSSVACLAPLCSAFESGVGAVARLAVLRHRQVLTQCRHSTSSSVYQRITDKINMSATASQVRCVLTDRCNVSPESPSQHVVDLLQQPGVTSVFGECSRIILTHAGCSQDPKTSHTAQEVAGDLVTFLARRYQPTSQWGESRHADCRGTALQVHSQLPRNACGCCSKY